ncbi:MAG TPA: 3'-5' exonuclease [Candidatus Dojkabacteria bacterium]|nr:3'-5' exonuclease [Candidatus Dojkabacteria bacterium]
MQTFAKYLNPIYKDLDSIVDFSNVKKDTNILQEEYPYLEHTTQITSSKLAFLLQKLHSLEIDLENQAMIIKAESGQDSILAAKSIYNKILNQIERVVDRINEELNVLDSPYFGKISFLSYDSTTGKPLTLYIGKSAKIDEKTNLPLIIDWRSPIANLYYQNSGPRQNVSFLAPIGEKKGNLLQKRQFQISLARIKGIYDAKSGNETADEFLLAQLNERLGKKLQDIVSTIQSQQNQIIRDQINNPIIVQGVAGSGKTTILLHRLAYLLYTYKDKISNENTLVIAPNQLFIDYISDVLPNLGISKIDSITYLFWAKKVLGWNDYYTVSTNEENPEIKEFKGSIDFLKILDQYIDTTEQNILENIPYTHKEIIINRYYELKNQFSNIDMSERLELAMEYAIHQEELKTSLSSKNYQNLTEVKSTLIQYFRKSLKIYSLYKKLFTTGLLLKDINSYSLKGLSTNGKIHTYRIEDLAPIVYLHLKIYGTKQYMRDYIVIDEAQDMSFVQIATLCLIARDGNITIAGDPAQSIIPPFYIKNWKNILALVEKYTKKKAKYYNLNKCYRTTIEIVQFANKIMKSFLDDSYELPEAVLRHGEKVEIINFSDSISKIPTNEIYKLISILKNQFENGSVTCAVLCKDRTHADQLFFKLKKYEKEIGKEVFDYSESNYQPGLHILPISNSKGLEFDTVVIADLYDEYYSTKEIDIKKLYVATTRALHKLYITTTHKSTILEKILN